MWWSPWAAAMAPLALPRNVSRANIDSEHCLAVVVDDALSAADCAALVGTYGDPARLKKVTDAAAPDGTRVVVPTPRNYSLGVFRDDGVTARLWTRLRDLPELARFRRFRDEPAPRGLNGRLRILRYAPGERFEPHYDLCVDDGDARSLVTVLVYLTAGFGGGATAFLDKDDPSGSSTTRVVPEVGRCVFFEHGLFHTGEEVAAGVKYVLRTDVMFPGSSCGRGPPAPRPVAPPTPSVAALLASVGLADHARAVASLGLLGSLDTFLAPGLPAVAEMLAAVDVPPEHVAALLAAAQEATDATPPAAAPPYATQAGAPPAPLPDFGAPR